MRPCHTIYLLIELNLILLRDNPKAVSSDKCPKFFGNTSQFRNNITDGWTFHLFATKTTMFS